MFFICCRQSLAGWWTRHEFAISNRASGVEEKRRIDESVWANF
jgi:hypothetical protein